MADNGEVKDVYRQVAEMVDRDDVVGVPVTPAFLKVLSLQFTEKEAELALKVGLAGGNIECLAEKTGIDKDKLKTMLNAMADKGTVWIDPRSDDPQYRILGSSAPGLVETGIWGGIRFPYDVELGKALHEVVVEWAREKLCKLGFPFAPVWAHHEFLPKDAGPDESLAAFLGEQDYFSVSYCPCRLSHWLSDPGNHCDHMLETCLHTGDTARWCVEHGQGREITYEEALELLCKSNENGLVHTININGFICNCCVDCCPMFIGFHEMNTQTLIPSPFVPRVNDDECISCGNCAERCPVNAIKMNDVAEIDLGTCIGCGLCIPTCASESIRLERRAPEELPAPPA